MSCQNNCLEIQVEACKDIFLKLSLIPDTEYIISIRAVGKHNVYNVLSLTNADGDFTIQNDMFPAGYFLAGNYYKVQIKHTDGEDVQIVTGMEAYHCVLIETVNIIELP